MMFWLLYSTTMITVLLQYSYCYDDQRRYAGLVHFFCNDLLVIRGGIYLSHDDHHGRRIDDARNLRVYHVDRRLSVTCISKFEISR